ncbi:hypothetical protein [Plebeiibacterium sediminum]|uniref:Uncharacterized protein n=1 Tax=Plebeiibacterium sediminum TaxID=2992112 RepID=A0AAE3M2F2_9BACT|nr:hypothetical protein [Plebeiobacterium sediminum]MCW3786041.1 hypothetical protein [Plebeiobacterium sediminum]
MNKSKLTVPDFILQSSIRINNSLNDDSIFSKVSEFGYNAEKIETGKALLNEVITLSASCNKKHNDVTIAYINKKNARNDAHQFISKYRSLAKIAFKNNTSAKTSLQLSGIYPLNYSGWLNQSKSFLRNILANNEWLSIMAGYGIDAVKLNDCLQKIDNVDALHQAILKAKGEAQNATLQRNKKIDELADWINDYEAVAKIALMETPQLLEKIGIIVKN